MAFGNENQSDGSVKNYEYNTLLYGARAGLSLFGFQFGPDYSEGLNVVKIKTKTNGEITKNETSKHQKKDLGIFVGYRFVDYRVWYTQIIDATLIQKGNSDKGLIHHGHGYAVGLGYRLSNSVSMNAEYRSFTYVDDENPSHDISGTQKYSPLNITEISFGLSWAIDIFGEEKNSKKEAGTAKDK